MSRLLIISVLSIFMACDWNNGADSSNAHRTINETDSLQLIADITTPPGYKRIQEDNDSFGAWLRKISLRKDKRVYLFNGLPKRSQRAQFAVLDISVGNKDLQQCADAVMRLRAEYLFSQKKYDQIEFRDNANKAYKWSGGADHSAFGKYLDKVFGMCGSASLEKQLKRVAFQDIRAGDVLIKGGFPGHAMIVVDVAINSKGNKVFMLAQSYMPAQDIHIVRNPADDKLNPWYEVTNEKEIITPEWEFTNEQLRRW
jgi:hypothetical protein